MRQLLFFAPLVIAQLSIAQADNCDSPETQAAMNECADKAFKKSDAELNAVYQKIKAHLTSDAEKTEMLVAAQRAWVTFRDTEYKFSASGVLGGSIYPSIYASCLDGLTKTRINDLKNYAACREGDLSCPVPAK